MEIITHTKQGLQILNVAEGATPAAVAEQVDAAGSSVYAEGSDVPLADGLTLIEQEVADGAHVFVGKHHKIAVTVAHNGATKNNEFPPSQRVERVFDWACGKQAFNLTPTDKAEHTLALDEEPVDLRRLVGSYADQHGKVRFDLVPKHRFEG